MKSTMKNIIDYSQNAFHSQYIIKLGKVLSMYIQYLIADENLHGLEINYKKQDNQKMHRRQKDAPMILALYAL